jgi:hypothetical protein
VVERILPDFQDFLLSRSLVHAKNAPFFAHWVSKFLAFSNKNQDLGPDLSVEKFLNHLKSQKKIADWQIKQAGEALRLYIHHFLDGKTSVLSPDVPQKRPFDVSKILSEMGQAIRIKHYSYRTERSYLEWVERFIDGTVRVHR